MPRAKGGDRVLGPYTEQDGRGKTRYKLIVHRGDKVAKQVFDRLDGPDGALEAKRQIEQQLVASVNRTIAGAIEEWEAWRRGEGIKDETLRNCRHMALGFFGGHVDKPLSWLTSARSGDRGQELYEARKARPGHQTGKRLAVASHKSALRIAKQFCAWCVGQKWIERNPLADVKAPRAARGTVKRRKRQLSIDAGRVYFDLAEQRAKAGDVGALAVLCAFLMHLRQSELTRRVVRDLDDRGRRLFIEEAKTESSDGMMPVPEMVRPMLLQLAKGKTPLAPLFESSKRQGAGFHATWLREQVHRLCYLSRVGLRPATSVRIKRLAAVRLRTGDIVVGQVYAREPGGAFVLSIKGEPPCTPEAGGFAVDSRFRNGALSNGNQGVGGVRLRFGADAEILAPAITAHSLRGMAASWLASRGLSPDLIAQMLRHADRGRVAEAHYIEPGAARAGQQAQLVELLTDDGDEEG